MRAIFVAAALALCAAPVPDAAAGPAVLFDEGHGQRFLASGRGELGLSGLAEAMRGAGLEVRARAGKLDAAALRGAGALVISGAFAPFAPDELEVIGAFMEAGGRVAVMVHVPQPVQGLLERMGIQYSKGPVHEADGLIQGRDSDFVVSRIGRHPFSEGLAKMSVFGCWALRTEDPETTVVASTGPRAWLDVDNDRRRSAKDPTGPVGIVLAGTLGKGGWVVFGDDALFQNRFLAAHNADAGRRLARWLASSPLGLPPAPRPRLQPGHQTRPRTTDL